MACNRVSYTYVTTHFLIWFLFQTPFRDPGHVRNVITWEVATLCLALGISCEMWWVFTWIWSKSVNLHCRKGAWLGRCGPTGAILKGKESCPWKASFTASSPACPLMAARHLESIVHTLCAQFPVGFHLRFSIKLTDFWCKNFLFGCYTYVHTTQWRTPLCCVQRNEVRNLLMTSDLFLRGPLLQF